MRGSFVQFCTRIVAKLQLPFMYDLWGDLVCFFLLLSEVDFTWKSLFFRNRAYLVSHLPARIKPILTFFTRVRGYPVESNPFLVVLCFSVKWILLPCNFAQKTSRNCNFRLCSIIKEDNVFSSSDRWQKSNSSQASPIPEVGPMVLYSTKTAAKNITRLIHYKKTLPRDFKTVSFWFSIVQCS
jgi:hypothetical protein